MYKLINSYGNDIQYTDSERKRDRLLDKGYREVIEKKARGGKGNAKNKNSTEGN